MDPLPGISTLYLVQTQKKNSNVLVPGSITSYQEASTVARLVHYMKQYTRIIKPPVKQELNKQFEV